MDTNTLTLTSNSMVPNDFNDDHHIHPLPEPPALYAAVVLLLFVGGSILVKYLRR